MESSILMPTLNIFKAPFIQENSSRGPFCPGKFSPDFTFNLGRSIIDAATCYCKHLRSISANDLFFSRLSFLTTKLIVDSYQLVFFGCILNCLIERNNQHRNSRARVNKALFNVIFKNRRVLYAFLKIFTSRLK